MNDMDPTTNPNNNSSSFNMNRWAEYLTGSGNNSKRESFLAIIGLLLGFWVMRVARLLAIIAAVVFAAFEALRQCGHINVDRDSMGGHIIGWLGRLKDWIGDGTVPLSAQRGFVAGMIVGAALP